jgi:hypothetical protein
MATWASEPPDAPPSESRVGGSSAANASASLAVALSRASDQRQGYGRLERFGAISFWGSGLSLLVGAASSGALLALALLPLLGFGYVVFCLVAMTGDRNVE